MRASVEDRAQQFRNDLFATPLPARKIPRLRDPQ
jgi:hypothetical protein